MLFAAVVLLVTGRYPQSIYDLVLGMNRWILRVAAYAGLMTDQYPPFRLDQGSEDPPAARLTVPPPNKQQQGPPHFPSTLRQTMVLTKTKPDAPTTNPFVPRAAVALASGLLIVTTLQAALTFGAPFGAAALGTSSGCWRRWAPVETAPTGSSCWFTRVPRFWRSASRCWGWDS